MLIGRRTEKSLALAKKSTAGACGQGDCMNV
jgi:hypothetical protein